MESKIRKALSVIGAVQTVVVVCKLAWDYRNKPEERNYDHIEIRNGRILSD